MENREYNSVRFLLDDDNKAVNFVYKPDPCKEPIAMDATLGVKFAQRQIILDEWWLIGGARWSRFKFRLKHPIVYSKRGLRHLWRKIKYIFVKLKMINPLTKLAHDK